ncbi:MAG: DUF4105 domain-containing protein [Spirochaetaceae bacterium]|nr:DUF4105 domain-containing protein [Spirochaetaceae bacterium]
MKKTGVFLAFLMTLSAANAAYPAETSGRGDYLTVKIAVIGPGDELYFWWGHLGLIVEDRLTGTSRFYDYGVFSFDNENFFLNFAFGRLLYSSVVSDASAVVNRYVETNRDITIFTLNLTSEQKEAILHAAERNVLPEYRDYLYNHFSDNCVTRITNLLDDALGGQFYGMAENAPGRYTLREHVRRHTYFSPFWDWLLNFLMGRSIDSPSTVKQELFLPSEVGRALRTFHYIDDNGTEQPLLASVEIINAATGRPPVLDKPVSQWPYALCLGTAIAFALLLFNLASKKHPVRGRLALALSQAFLGLLLGLAGSVAFFMAFFTNHDYSWRNINIVFVNPLLLAAVPLGFITAFSKKECRRVLCKKLLKGLWTYIFLGGVLTVPLGLLPGYGQQNQATVALIAPFALVLSFIPDWLGSIRKSQSNPRG